MNRPRRVNSLLEISMWLWHRKGHLTELVLLAFLLIPNNHQGVQDVRAYIALWAVFILPGYIGTRILTLCGCQLFEKSADRLERWATYLAVGSVLALIPWILVFFIGIAIPQVVQALIALEIAGLLVLTLLDHTECDSRANPKYLSTVCVLVTATVLATTFGAYIYGGLVTFDAYTSMPYLRNLYVGDTSPSEWSPMGFEENPPFTSANSPLLLGYAMGALASRTDPVVIWTRAPAFWALFMLTVGYTLTKFLFRKRSIAIASLVLAPLVYGRFPMSSALGRPNVLPTFVLLPLALFFSLSYILYNHQKGSRMWLSALLGVHLLVNHPAHFVWFALLLATYGAGLLFVKPRSRAWLSRIVATVVLTCVLSIGPALWMRSLDTAGEATITFATLPSVAETGHLDRGMYWELAPDVFIVSPRYMFGEWVSGPWVGFLSIIAVLIFARKFVRDERTIFLVTSVSIVLIVATNPFLIRMLAGAVHSSIVHRLSSCLPVLPAVSFGLFTSCVTVIRTVRKNKWNLQATLYPKSKRQTRALFVIALALPLLTLRLLSMGGEAIRVKMIDVLYSPSQMSPVWLNRKLRSMADEKLTHSRFPITESPTRLSRYLDADTTNFIKTQLQDDQVFLSEPLTEIILPAYVDQRIFAGGRNLKGICQPYTSDYELTTRQVDQCTILDQNSSEEEIKEAILRVADEVDYILVVPMREYLAKRLSRLDIGEKIYDQNGFSIWEIDDG
jgi:hypothetical protein